MATDDRPAQPDRDATVVGPPVAAPPPDGAHATRGTARDAVAAQRDRFGGIKWGAAFFGWLSANGFAVILVALLSAAGVALGLADGLDTAGEAADEAAQEADPWASAAESRCWRSCSWPIWPAATSPAAWPASTARGKAWPPG